MTHRRTPGLAAVGAALVVLLAAGCGSGNGPSASGTAPSTPPASTPLSSAPSDGGAASTSGSGPAPAARCGSGRRTPPLWQPPLTLAAVKSAGLTAYPNEHLVAHYHAHLDIIENGKAVPIAPYVGFVQQGSSVTVAELHTHDDTGVIHIETADRNASYTLGQFFTEWNVAFGADCVGDAMAGNGKRLAFFVDGKPFAGDPRAIVFKAHEEIAVWYGDASATPKVPSSYSFPANE